MTKSLEQQWLDCKEIESDAKARRLEIEDEMIEAARIDETNEGTTTFASDEYETKITTKLNTKIDADELEKVASENGLNYYLNSLFRWKPSIIKKEWDKADETVRNTLLRAMETKPAKPSISIKHKE